MISNNHRRSFALEEPIGFLTRLNLDIPIIQAPMAGISTPALAAAVSNHGALGSIAVGAVNAAAARAMIQQVRGRTDRAFNVNLFAHRKARHRPLREAAWLRFLKPSFARFDAEPPHSLRIIYRSFVDDPDKLKILLELAPAVVSFHFGLPPPHVITALRERDILLLATATNASEARTIAAAGIDAIVAQGVEAGGHRGMFDPAARDDGLSTERLVRLLAKTSPIPVIAAGAIMDGKAIAAMLKLGAVAVQMGTAFIACPESAADEAYRSALIGAHGEQTILTEMISGRPGRLIKNEFTGLVAQIGKHLPPDYPIAYDAGKALAAAAKAKGENGFSAHWAGAGVAQIRALPASELLEKLKAEILHERANG